MKESELRDRTLESNGEIKKEIRFTVKPDQVDDAREFLGTVLQEQPYSGQKSADHLLCYTRVQSSSQWFY